MTVVVWSLLGSESRSLLASIIRLRLERSDDPRAEVEHLREVAIQIMLGMMTGAS
ncbi:MAG TPA: hypothetical protein VHU17_19175 [Acidimicrobiales bacterium]|jgi:hypothetical protein|nr:hypothetical protein [Acidimicrobiales bacterium]